jgi:adenylate cyclase
LQGLDLRQARIQRRLAAILVVDMVGYSRHMSEDEPGTLRRFKTLLRDGISRQVAACGGHIVKTTGDGVLIEFSSAIDAVRAAVDVQRSIAKIEAKTQPEKRMAFRIGIHVGEVVSEDGDVFGDAVNIAVRLEPLAEPGGIAFSHTVHDQIGHNLGLAFDDIGEQTLKNIGRPIRVFRLSAATISAKLPGARVTNAPQPLPVPTTRASIAVLPFQSLDPASPDDYFADGIVEDIITSLCHFSFLFVIARNTSFTYKGRHVDARQVARELGVRYLADGSVRRSGSRIRVTAEMIDAETAHSIWAHRFESESADPFELQDIVTRRIVTSIEPRVREAEIERAKRKPAASLDAYDYYLRALPYRVVQTADATREALSFLRKSIAIDPNYAPALAQAATCYQKLHDQGYDSLGPEEIAEGLRLANAAISADMSDAVALCQAAHVIASFTHETARPIDLLDRALVINPNLAEGWTRSSWVRISAGLLEEAIDHAERAIELNPLDPALFVPLCAQGYASLFLGRFEQAADCALRVMRGRDVPEMAHRLLVVAMERLGRENEMRAAAVELLDKFPRFRIAEWSARSFYANPEQRNTMLSGLRKAGLPE